MTALASPSSGPDRRMVGAPPGARLVAGFLFLTGLGVLGIWATNLAGGSFGGAGGLFVYQDGNYPIFHVTAEAIMALTSIVAGVALWRGVRSGRLLAMLAIGMLVYSAVNSSGWPVRNDPTLLLPMGITLVGAVLSMPHLLSGADCSR